MRRRFESSNPEGKFIDDVTLLRFLAADRFNVERGLARLLKTLRWRENHNVDDILSTPPARLDVYQKIRVRCFIGADHSSRPILIERLTQFTDNGPGFGKPFDSEEWARLYAWDLERHFPEMRACAKRSGKPITRYTYVADARGTSWKMISVVKLVQFLTKSVEEYYPEMVGHILLINAPRIVSIIFNRCFKHFLDPVTASKVEIHSGCERLLELADPSVIPVEFGGTSPFVLPQCVPWESCNHCEAPLPDPPLQRSGPQSPWSSWLGWTSCFARDGITQSCKPFDNVADFDKGPVCDDAKAIAVQEYMFSRFEEPQATSDKSCTTKMPARLARVRSLRGWPKLMAIAMIATSMALLNLDTALADASMQLVLI
jgi:hypothetical protein